MKKTLVVCALMATAACESGMRSPVSPSAAVGSVAALNSDGSNLKATSPLALSPVFESTNINVAPTLAGRAGAGKYGPVTLAQRFQVADSEDFSNIVSSGMGETDATGITRFSVSPPLSAGRRYVWRLRAEMNDAFGPWSNVMAFTTAGASATPLPPTGPVSSGPRPPDPPPGVRLPLPDFSGLVGPLGGDFSNSQSCPRGLKYVNNPWQDRVIDGFRQRDSRWGYNGKPNRTAADNEGVPVVAAGDEAAYHYSGGPDQGSTEVHLVDMLLSHCGTPSLTWRVFTGEEPGFWTGAGRF
jgi:hypothetical protein